MPEKSGTGAVVGMESAAYAAVLTAQNTQTLKLDRVIGTLIELPFLAAWRASAALEIVFGSSAKTLPMPQPTIWP